MISARLVRISALALVALAALLVAAWVNGGPREPRTIVEPVVLPGASR